MAAEQPSQAEAPPECRRGNFHCWLTLRRCGIKVAWWAHWRAIWSLIVVGAAVVAVLTDRNDQRLEWLVPGIFVGGILIASFFEWRSSRHEASLDKFYERLCIVNQSREKLGEPAETSFELKCADETFTLVQRRAPDPDEVPPDAEQVPPFRMYVFRELDNLEYLLERYRLGYLSARLAHRGVATFASRFAIERFGREIEALQLVDTGYNQETADAVATVKREWRGVLRKNLPRRAGRSLFP